MIHPAPPSRLPKDLVAGSFAALVWVGIAGLSISLFAQRHVSGWSLTRGYFPYREVLGFGSAFLAAGATGGVCLIGFLAGRRALIVMGLALAFAQATAYATLGSLPDIFGPRFARARWASGQRWQLLSFVSPGIAAGIALGVVVALAAGGLWLAIRRASTRRRGLVVVAGLVASTIGILPRLAVAVSELWVEVRWRYGWSDTEAMIGVGAGAPAGAAAGVISTALVAMAFGFGRHRRAA